MYVPLSFNIRWDLPGPNSKVEIKMTGSHENIILIRVPDNLTWHGLNQEWYWLPSLASKNQNLILLIHHRFVYTLQKISIRRKSTKYKYPKYMKLSLQGYVSFIFYTSIKNDLVNTSWATGAGRCEIRTPFEIELAGPGTVLAGAQWGNSRKCVDVYELRNPAASCKF